MSFLPTSQKTLRKSASIITSSISSARGETRYPRRSCNVFDAGRGRFFLHRAGCALDDSQHIASDTDARCRTRRTISAGYVRTVGIYTDSDAEIARVHVQRE